MADPNITFTIKMVNQAKSVIADVTKDLKSMSGSVFSGTANSGVMAAAAQYNTSLKETKNIMGEVGSASAVLAQAHQKTTEAVKNSNVAVDEHRQKYKSLMREYREGAAGFSSFSNMIKIGIGLLAGNELLNMADEYTRLTGKIAMLTTNETQAIAVRERLIDVSMKTHTALSTNVEIYERMREATKVYGKSQNETVNLVQTLNEAFKLGGHSAEEAASATTRFAFALSSGRVRGLEFNQIMKESPALMKAMEKEMGKPAGYIRAMIQQGKMSTKELLDAVEKAGPELNKQFSKLPITIKDGLQDAKTGFLAFIGEVGAKMKTSESIGNFFSRIGAGLRDPAFIASVERIATYIGQVLNVALTKAGDLFALVSRNADILKGVMIALFAVFAVQKIDGMVNAFDALARTGKALPGVFGLIQKAWLSLMAVWEANPFVLLAVGVAAATAALIAFGGEVDASGKNAYTFKDVAVGAWDEFKDHVVSVYTDLRRESDDTKTQGIKDATDEADARTTEWERIKTATRQWYNESVALFKFFEMALDLTFNNTWGAFEIMITSMENALKHGVENMVNWFKEGFAQIAQSADSHGGVVGHAIGSIFKAAGGDGKKFSLGADIPDDEYMKQARIKAQAFQDFINSPVRDAAGEQGTKAARARKLAEIMGTKLGAGDGMDDTTDPEKLQPGKGARQKKGPKDKAPGEIQAVKDYIEKMKEAIEETRLLAEQEWFGPGAKRAAEVINAGNKAYQEQEKKLKDVDEATKKKLLTEVRAVAQADELAKQLKKEADAYIKLRDAVVALNEATADTLKSNAAILMAEGSAKDKYLHNLAVEIEQQKLLKEVKRDDYLKDAAGNANYEAARVAAMKAGSDSVNSKDQTKQLDIVKKILTDTAKPQQLAIDNYRAMARSVDDLAAAGTLAGKNLEIVRARMLELKPPTNVIEALKTGFNSFAKDFEMTYAKVADGIKGIAGNVANAFVEMAATGKMNFKSLALSVVQDLLRMIAKALLFKAITAAMGALFPGSSGIITTLSGSAGSSAVPSWLAPQNHTGGIAGMHSDTMRMVSSSVFQDAVRHHTGGIAGLKSGEVPIIANAGEAIMPTVRLPDGSFGVKSTGGGRGNSVFAPNISVNIDASNNSGGGGGNNAMQTADHHKMSKMLEDELNTHLQRKLEQWQRPGGPLDRFRK